MGLGGGSLAAAAAVYIHMLMKGTLRWALAAVGQAATNLNSPVV